MPRGRYRITNPTLAMKTNDDHGNTALTVPTGAFIFIDSESFNGNHLIDVQWEGNSVMMSTLDLRKAMPSPENRMPVVSSFWSR
jgi:hypothetical protein